MSQIIRALHGRQILDSRGNPTVEADITLADGSFGRAAVPSGASTGSNEAVEKRDGAAAYNGKGVLTAVTEINQSISSLLIGTKYEQATLDGALIELDGTPNKNRLGANAILAVSLAFAKATAMSQHQPLYRYAAELVGNTTFVLPLPMMNIINGGKHAADSTDIQEFMILPIGASSFTAAIQMGAEIFHALAKVLTSKGYTTTVGDEGGYAPRVKQGNAEALDLIVKAIDQTNYKLGSDVGLALDVASTELLHDGIYNLMTEAKQLSAAEMIDYYGDLTARYPILSIEDGLGEQDWAGWQQLHTQLGGKVQLVGDDIFVTNTAYLAKGIQLNAANAILIKPNQIGTLTETIAAVKMAHQAGWRTIMSHRSGETEDTTIAHLAVGLGCSQIKTGSLSRSDRIAKYNELLRIEEALGSTVAYRGTSALGHT
jgi:enolase